MEGSNSNAADGRCALCILLGAELLLRFEFVGIFFFGIAHTRFLNSFPKCFYPRIECDEDGWLLTVNDEPPYQTFFHKFSPSLIKTLKVQGKVEISYVGIGSQSEGLSSAPPVGFNLTFVCPEGQVFSSDWFATPFVFMTCKEDGSFDEPSWDEYECVFRKFYHI